MTPQEAIDTAKAYVIQMFASDGATNVGLEELRFDEHEEHWLVTVGFTRAWEGPQGVSRWTGGDAGQPWPRTFKTVEIADKDGRVLQLRHWPVAA